ncbi:MAG: cytidine deaminase [Lachnospiraceae bacterium]|jgi:cytidine deaminase
MLEWNREILIQKAIEAKKMAYAPYSQFHVGAALLGKSGKIYTGCNVENSSYPAGICGERTAISKAVSEGETEFQAIAIAGSLKDQDAEQYCMPCGICRQVMAEFCKEDFIILAVKNEIDYKEMTLGELLPESFHL